MGKKYVYEKNQAFHRSPRERPCFHSGAVSTQGHAFVYDLGNLVADKSYIRIRILCGSNPRLNIHSDIVD